MSKIIKNIVPISMMAIEEDGCHLMIKALINGHDANLLIDTGASRTVFDDERILSFLDDQEFDFEINEKLSTGLGTSSMESKSVTIKEIRLGELEIKDYTAVVLEMSHVNESYAKLGLPGIDGVLGGDLLEEYGVVIDYSAKELRF
ncbi:MAG: retropepsin-like aspartic protease [Bacteroidota bacterium]|nr:retropepsin-like aspartic protease [Bacteroidota bacterium]